MVQRDLIKDQIEELGRVLARIVGLFLGINDQGDVTNQVQYAKEELKSQLDIDLDVMLGLELTELKEHIQQLDLSSSYVESIADFVYKIGVFQKSCDHNVEYKRYFVLALQLLEIADGGSDIYSFDRVSLKKNIMDEL